MTYFKTIIITLTVIYIIFGLSETVNAGVFQDEVNSAISWGINTGGLSGLPLFPPAASPNDPSILTNIIAFLEALVATVSTLLIIIGGFMYIISAGDETKTSRAKKIVFSALGGLLIVLLANALANAVKGIYSGTPYISKLKATIINSITLALFFTALVAVAAFIYGGFTYITSGGSEEKAQRGKKIIIYAIIGIVIIMLSASIVNIVINPGP